MPRTLQSETSQEKRAFNFKAKLNPKWFQWHSCSHVLTRVGMCEEPTQHASTKTRRVQPVLLGFPGIMQRMTAAKSSSCLLGYFKVRKTCWVCMFLSDLARSWQGPVLLSCHISVAHQLLVLCLPSCCLRSCREVSTGIWMTTDISTISTSCSNTPFPVISVPGAGQPACHLLSSVADNDKAASVHCGAFWIFVHTPQICWVSQVGLL